MEKMGLTSYVAQLPEGYHTELMPSGRNLPASVRTKLLLARTMMGEPRLLALGDFGASLSIADHASNCRSVDHHKQRRYRTRRVHDPYFASQAAIASSTWKTVT